jgi:hypothetical protein
LPQIFYYFATLVQNCCYKVSGEVFGEVGLASIAQSFWYNVSGEFPVKYCAPAMSPVSLLIFSQTIFCFNKTKAGFFLLQRRKNLDLR